MVRLSITLELKLCIPCMVSNSICLPCEQIAAPPIHRVWKEKVTPLFTVYLPVEKTSFWSFFTGQTTGLTSELSIQGSHRWRRSKTPAEPSDDLCTQFLKSDADLECDQIWILVLYFNDCLCLSAAIKVTLCGALTL